MKTLAENKHAYLDRFIIFFILFLIFWAPIPLGSNRDWSAAFLIILISFAGLIWGVGLVFRSNPLKNESLRPALFMFGLLVFSQIWVAFQWLFGLSANPGATFKYLMLGASYALLFLMIVVVFNTRKRLNLLIITLIISGTFQAFWGASMVLSGIEWLFGIPKEHYLDKATGTYVNRNHLAGYLEMTITLSIGYMLAYREGKDFTWRGAFELLLSNKVLVRLAIIIMVIGLVMSQSRMGNTAFVVSLVLVGFLFILTFKKHRKRNLAILLSFIVIDVLIISQYFGLERLKDRLVNTEVSISQNSGQLVFDINDLRGMAFNSSIPLAQEKAFTGHGAGSFEVVFISHAGPDFGGYFKHAHNDYIQFWVEFGLIGSLPLLAFVSLSLYLAVRALREKHSYYRSGIGIGASMAILAILIHSFSDFNLQIPANAMTFIVVCAIAVITYVHKLRSPRIKKVEDQF